MDVEAKKSALKAALSRMGALMDDFENVVRHSGEEPSHPTADADFSDAVKKLYPDPSSPDKVGGAGRKSLGFPSLLDEVELAVSAADEDARLHMSFGALQSECLECQRCVLCKTRRNVVFGEGCAERPVVMVIGEGPGENEDNTGRPFVGKAGQFLDKWLAAIGLDRSSNAYITNIVKCRPPMNRDPLPDEKTSCLPFLKQQIALIQPQAILCLGKPASTLVTGMDDSSMGALHGRFFFYDGIPMMCTYHPAAVLRDLTLKRPVWEDLKKLARYLGLALPS